MSGPSSSDYLDMDLLRFTTAGSVDDGKSTLIGRLLFDSKAIFDDQYDAIKRSSEQRGEDYVNLALLTDGLRAEREQGITIDVAYRYFATPRRKFIIADTPGHIQYTRNMVTGASTADLAIILVDARNGVVEQTCRHAIIASLLRIRHVVVCVNKMDLVGYEQRVFDAIRGAFTEFAAKLDPIDLHFLPISALRGDNVVEPSEAMASWYTGPTLLGLLETIPVAPAIGAVGVHHAGRFPVQYVIRPQTAEYHDFRGYAGRVAAGVFGKGDPVLVLPSGLSSTIKTIETFDGPLDQAWAPMSVTITLDDEMDISRGDMIIGAGSSSGGGGQREGAPEVSQDLDLMVCWLHPRQLTPSGKYAVKHTTRDTRCVVRQVAYKLDINTLRAIEDDKTVAMNDIARISIRTTQPLVFDRYRANRTTGSLILIDEATNETVGAGMIV